MKIAAPFHLRSVYAPDLYPRGMCILYDNGHATLTHSCEPRNKRTTRGSNNLVGILESKAPYHVDRVVSLALPWLAIMITETPLITTENALMNNST